MDDAASKSLAPPRTALLYRVATAQREGKTMTEVASEYGVSRVTLYRWLKRAKLEPKIRNRTNHATPEVLRELRAQGMSWKDIAAVFAISDRALRYRRATLRKHGHEIE